MVSGAVCSADTAERKVQTAVLRTSSLQLAECVIPCSLLVESRYAFRLPLMQLYGVPLLCTGSLGFWALE